MTVRYNTEYLQSKKLPIQIVVKFEDENSKLTKYKITAGTWKEG